MKLTHLDLFSGIGGFALAAQRAGFETVGLSEIDEHACRVLARHWPNVRNYGNIRNADFSGLRDGITLLTGGFPCQPFSLAGQRRGSEDDRHLWPAMLGAIDTIRPAWVLGENVPGLISMGLDTVLADLEGRGYAAQPFVVPACAVDAQHRRDRLWIVAYADGRRGGADSSRRHDANGKDAGRSQANGLPRTLRDSGRTQNMANANGIDGEVLVAGCADAAGWTEPRTRPTGSCGDGGASWPPEPGVGRVADGIPARTHRLRGLGNAIVPQVAERFCCFIAQIEASAFAEAP